jgi:general secretion pathway protein D
MTIGSSIRRKQPVGAAVLRHLVSTLVALLALLPLPSFAAAPEGFTVETELATLSKARQVIDAAAIDVVLGLGYEEKGAAVGGWRMTAVRGLESVRLFSKSVGGATRTLELAVAPRPGGFDLRGTGLERNGAEEGANPDLADAEGRIRKVLGKIAAKPAGKAVVRPGLETYQLGYIQSDRAIAVLKALGYGVVEFTAGKAESFFERVFEPSTAERKFPYVVKLVDSSKTSLMEPLFPEPGSSNVPSRSSGGGGAPIPELGGTYLHQVTTSDPQQRLLVVYDQEDPDAMEVLLNVIREKIDVPARQVSISALVIEIDTTKLHSLGIEYSGGNGRNEYSFGDKSATGAISPFAYAFDSLAEIAPSLFRARLEALVEKGEAEILSSPSVLVLDGRQARIQIGQQVPVVKETKTAIETSNSVEYFPVGIVLNLRPRVSTDGAQVSMQVETIVSALADQGSTATVSVAPVVENRQVQTFVRVADNTPFIIGGLISEDHRERTSGIPYLSNIPFFGALFRHNQDDVSKKEVIVVLTPHVVPLDDQSFSYLIPKDAGRFDSFGNQLFRNAYRIKSSDLYDLRFVSESEFLKGQLAVLREAARENPGLERREPFASLLAGHVPGEEILVRRMLWEVVRRTGYLDKVPLDKVFLFSSPDKPLHPTDFEVKTLKDELAKLTPEKNALVLTFDAKAGGTAAHPFVQPRTIESFERVTRDDFEARLVSLNSRDAGGEPEKWGLIMSDQFSGQRSPMDVLKGVLVLKKILSLNTSLPLTIEDFYVGRQIIFPTEDDIVQSSHIIDRDAVRLFYEIKEYYRAFEAEFNHRTARLVEELEAAKAGR